MAAMIISKKSRPQPVYGFDHETNAKEVSDLIDKIRKDMGVEKMNKTRIFVLSGTHGDEKGNLTGEKVFFMEDKSKELQTVTAVNVNESTPANTWKRYFDQTDAILILAWCFSGSWKDLATYNA